MKLNRIDCEMLDTLLEAFGSTGSLSREQVLKIFDGDETIASSLVKVLADNGFVMEVGHVEEQDLPLLINRESTAVLFLKNGGFTGAYDAETAARASAGELELLQKENLGLQNEKLVYEQTLREREERIRTLELKIRRMEYLKYLWWAAGLLTSGIAVWLYRLLA